MPIRVVAWLGEGERPGPAISGERRRRCEPLLYALVVAPWLGNLHHVGRRDAPVEQAQPEAMPHDKPWSSAEAKWLYQDPLAGVTCASCAQLLAEYNADSYFTARRCDTLPASCGTASCCRSSRLAVPRFALALVICMAVAEQLTTLPVPFLRPWSYHS